ncbi:uncharacterized protein LOC127871054 [Dreissena polymorpha]|uniref:KY-like immunoglobulin-like domain-containing protein n=1 Tax=Dreissena polymorpha TaxID=45954 RepID=A0A9D4LD64_DREPO|nr:uncharacterized protein LOC127871054 [Dreissena polymorpha]XP_052269642.1 uncharacterized protein LOC127871054 [Dreissena polymorpha]KAH3855603.1 hypothetical protein DPMN_098173 [Dreissena polymorpha]
MAGKPELPHGYLGAQSKFEEFGLSTESHFEPEIHTDTNQLEVKIRTSKPSKVTANLTHCGRSEELPQHVFTQTKDNVVSFLVSLPEVGYYKLQIFALLLPDDSKTLPGVYNYLINCTKLSSAIVNYPKQFAQWKEGCYIVEPASLSSHGNLSNVRFEAFIPNAKSSAIVADGTWSHLSRNAAGLWEGRVDLTPYKGRDAKVTLNANYGEDNKFSTLLEYRI